MHSHKPALRACLFAGPVVMADNGDAEALPSLLALMAAVGVGAAMGVAALANWQRHRGRAEVRDPE